MVEMAKSTRILQSALTWFLWRTVPASRKAKPPCMANTSTAPTSRNSTSAPLCSPATAFWISGMPPSPGLARPMFVQQPEIPAACLNYRQSGKRLCQVACAALPTGRTTWGRGEDARSRSGLPHPARVHVEVGFLFLEPRRVLAGDHIVRQPAHVAAGIRVEDEHAAEQLEHHHQPRVGVLGLHPAHPVAADREDPAVEPADGLVVVVIERVVAAEVDEVAPQPVELRYVTLQ